MNAHSAEKDGPVPGPGFAVIQQERQRQIAVEGYSRQHDMAHGSDRLLRAARCYEVPQNRPGVPDAWPWESQWWKPKDLLSNLIRAGALYQAAIDVAPPLGQDRDRAREGLDRCVAAIDGFAEHLARVTPPGVGA